MKNDRPFGIQDAIDFLAENGLVVNKYVIEDLTNHGQLINVMTIGDPFEQVIDELKAKLGILPEHNAIEHTYELNGYTYHTEDDVNGLTIMVRLDDTLARKLGNKDLGSMLAKKNAALYEDLMFVFGYVPTYLPLVINDELLYSPR
jgi:hypothetical protein